MELHWSLLGFRLGGTIASAYYYSPVYSLVMATLCNTAGHYIFALWFLFLSFYLFFLA